MEIYTKISHILLNDWDPIGINGEGAAKDEYDEYARGLTQMIVRNQCQDKIEDYLLKKETDMGVIVNITRIKSVASIISSLKK